MPPTTRGLGFFSWSSQEMHCCGVEIWVASGNEHGEIKGMLVAMSVPLSQNCSPYLPTIAHKFYFDQVTSAFLGGVALAVHIKRNANTHQSPAFPPTSICFLIVCLLGSKRMLDVNGMLSSVFDWPAIGWNICLCFFKGWCYPWITVKIASFPDLPEEIACLPPRPLSSSCSGTH